MARCSRDPLAGPAARARFGLSPPPALVEHPALARVRARAAACGLALEIRRHPATTRTAEDAAREVGCELAQVVKSLVFLAAGEPLVVLVSGGDRVDVERLAAACGATSARRATAAEVRDATGFPIGGVAPFAHGAPLPVLIDRALLEHDVVWAAAGLPDAVFPISPVDLVTLSAGVVVDVAV